MRCEKCGAVMLIDEWGGWIWICYVCGNIGRSATDEEVKDWEERYVKDGEKHDGRPTMIGWSRKEVTEPC